MQRNAEEGHRPCEDRPASREVGGEGGGKENHDSITLPPPPGVMSGSRKKAAVGSNRFIPSRNLKFPKKETEKKSNIPQKTDKI